MESSDYRDIREHRLRPLHRIEVAAAVVWDGDRVLLTQRPPGGPHGLMWEFPGGKIEAGETPEHALAREILEELGAAVVPLEVLAVETHDYARGPHVEIYFVHCELAGEVLRPSPEIHAVQWARPHEVDPATVLAADRMFLARLVHLRRARRWG